MKTPQPTVLLVDDNFINRKVSEQILILSGCLVHACDSGAEAINHIKARTYDFVFMDCMMPQMDGYEATVEIRLQANFRKIPIVALSSLNDEAHHNKCFLSGMSDVVIKPLTMEMVEGILKKYAKIF